MRSKLLSALALGAGLSVCALPAIAQYKIVGPDGRVTYTDRPPSDGSLTVTDLASAGRTSASSQSGPSGPSLPDALKRVADRFPVTLFTSQDCSPCEAGRDYLKRRGIPYVERQVVNSDDAAALERTVGGRTLPALTVGGQALRGFGADDWASYLDAAGYPQQSQLPAGWEPAPPSPLVARVPVTTRTNQRPAPAQAPEAPERIPPSTGTTIRF